MIWAHLSSLLILLIVFTCHAKAEEDNDIRIPKPPFTLDPNLRKALLRALTELENEESSDKRTGKLMINDDGRTIEKASASAISFYTNTEKSVVTSQNIKTTTTLENLDEDESSEKKKHYVVIQRSSGVEQKSLPSVVRNDLDPINDAEQFLASASSSFTSGNKLLHQKVEQTRSIGGSSNNFIGSTKDESKNTKSKIETTTPFTTTTSTEENEAKVEHVQFFSAPLVTAFTVHEDERGIPKSVVPIYKTSGQHAVTQSQVDEKHRNIASEELRKKQLLQAQAEEERRTQLTLEYKQKSLEDEIRRLRKQQEQQETLRTLYEQQISAHQQRFQDFRNQQNESPFVPIVQSTTPRSFATLHNSATASPVHTPFAATPAARNPLAPNRGTLVAFQPSVSAIFNSNQISTPLPLNAQILPVRQASDFRTPFTYHTNFQRVQPQPQFQNVARPLVASAPAFVHPSASFNIVPSFQPTPQQLFSQQAPRVFRQESQTGNFGNNFAPLSFSDNNYFSSNRYQTLPQEVVQPTRVFRSNLEGTQTGFNNNFNRPQSAPVNHQQLDNLLYYSGIGRGKQQEDLNIVSKVLSLNHLGGGGGDYRFASSKINEQRIPSPYYKFF